MLLQNPPATQSIQYQDDWSVHQATAHPVPPQQLAPALRVLTSPRITRRHHDLLPASALKWLFRYDYEIARHQGVPALTAEHRSVSTEYQNYPHPVVAVPHGMPPASWLHRPNLQQPHEIRFARHQSEDPVASRLPEYCPARLLHQNRSPLYRP